jgi:hypothetical protein
VSAQTIVPLVGAFLVGAATGRWFSARKQVASAVASVRAELSAVADASNRNVVIVGGIDHDGSHIYDLHDGSADYHIAALIDHHDDHQRAVTSGVYRSDRAGSHPSFGTARPGGRGVRHLRTVEPHEVQGVTPWED